MSDANENMLLEAETDFGLSLLRAQPLNESLVFSPLSIALALSLLHAGAQGNSRSQIANAIAKGANDDQLAQHYAGIAATLKDAKNDVTTNIANRVFVKNGFPIKQSYLDIVQKQYNAAAVETDFDNKAEAAKKINQFVLDNTGGKIKDMISADSLDEVVAVLVNAMYFKGKWEHEFYKTQNVEKDFFSSENNKRKITYLSDNEIYRNYAKDDTFEVLSLNYKDTSYSFTVFLPTQRFGLEKALKELTASRVQKLLKDLKNTYLTVTIPKFKVEKELELPAFLKQLGIKDVFDESAANMKNLSDKATYVSDAVHKAVIEVDHEGTTAAASTAFKITLEMASRATAVVFTADHPFAFALVKDNHPMFLGVHA